MARSTKSKSSSEKIPIRMPISRPATVPTHLNIKRRKKQ